MSKKHRTNGGIMYSTNPHQALSNSAPESPSVAVSPLKQDLRIMLDKKQRSGKSVTLVTGYQGNPQGLEDLARMLKSRCGVGGSHKEGYVLIQGDFREKVAAILKSEGYRAKLV